MSHKALAGASRFAHLLGFGASKAEKPKDDEDSDAQPERMEDESDEDYAKRCDEAKSKSKTKKAAGPDRGKGAEDDDPDDEGEAGDDESGKDDDGKTGDKVKKAKSAGAMEERARCAAIVAHGVKTGQVRQACVLAFDTDLDAKAATLSLAAMATDTAQSKAPALLRERMDREAPPNVGADIGSSGPDLSTPEGKAAAAAAQIIEAGRKARGEKA